MKFLLLLLLSLLLSANNYCYSCHEQITLANSYTQNEWKEFHASKTPFKKIHKKNLKVLQYLHSQAYDANKFYEDMLFFAPLKKEDVIDNSFSSGSPYKECFICHNNNLYNLWVKSQWAQLEQKREELAQIHKDNLDIYAFIRSKEFDKILPELKKKALSRAQNPQLITIKEGKIRFTLDLDDATKEYTKELFIALKQEIKAHHIQNEISFYLQRGEDNSNPISLAMTFMSGFIMPSAKEATWFMQVNYKKRAYMLYTTKSYTKGILTKTSPLLKSEDIKVLITLFIQELQKSTRDNLVF